MTTDLMARQQQGEHIDMMTRTLRVTAAAAACLSLLAGTIGVAGASTRLSAPRAKAHASSVTLDFPSWQATEPGYEQFYDSMIKQFDAAHPGVKVHFYEVTYDNYMQTITTRMAAGDAPDILVLPLTNYGTFAASGQMTNLNSYLAGTDILNSWAPLQKSLKINGKYYNVLVQGASYVLYANQQILKAHHMAMPRTVAQLITDAKQLTGNGSYGIALPTAQDPNIPNFVMALVTGQGYSALKNNTYDFTNPGVQSAVNEYRQLAKYAAPGLITEQSRQIYFSGKAAFMLDGTFELPAIKQQGTAAVAANTVMLPFPTKYQVSYVSSTLGIPASIPSADKQLVWDFIKQVTEPASQRLFVKDIEAPAPRLSVDSTGAYPFGAVQNAAARGRDIVPSQPWFVENYGEISTDLGTAMSKLLSSNASTDAVLKELEGELPSPGKS